MLEEPPTWTDERLKSLIISWEDFLASGSLEDGAAPPSAFTRVPFTHPQFVLYSSGTTVRPKQAASKRTLYI